jgi:hypothetical protein
MQVLPAAHRVEPVVNSIYEVIYYQVQEADHHHAICHRIAIDFRV